MSRDPSGPVAGEPPGEEPEPHGTVTPTGPGPLVGSAVVALVVGWALRPLALRSGSVEPQVPLATVLLVAFVAVVVGATAYLTRRTVRRAPADLLPHQAVNRLVLGKACALVGALVAGGFLGYALAQVGVGDPMATSRLWRSVLGGVAGLSLVAASLLLEHACRVPKRKP